MTFIFRKRRAGFGRLRSFDWMHAHKDGRAVLVEDAGLRTLSGLRYRGPVWVLEIMWRRA